MFLAVSRVSSRNLWGFTQKIKVIHLLRSEIIENSGCQVCTWISKKPLAPKTPACRNTKGLIERVLYDGEWSTDLDACIPCHRKQHPLLIPKDIHYVDLSFSSSFDLRTVDLQQVMIRSLHHRHVEMDQIQKTEKASILNEVHALLVRDEVGMVIFVQRTSSVSSAVSWCSSAQRFEI